jgi:hypothetical protein
VFPGEAELRINSALICLSDLSLAGEVSIDAELGKTGSGAEISLHQLSYVAARCWVIKCYCNGDPAMVAVIRHGREWEHVADVLPRVVGPMAAARGVQSVAASPSAARSAFAASRSYCTASSRSRAFITRVVTSSATWRARAAFRR